MNRRKNKRICLAVAIQQVVDITYNKKQISWNSEPCWLIQDGLLLLVVVTHNGREIKQQMTCCITKAWQASVEYRHKYHKHKHTYTNQHCLFPHTTSDQTWQCPMVFTPDLSESLSYNPSGLQLSSVGVAHSSPVSQYLIDIIRRISTSSFGPLSSTQLTWWGPPSSGVSDTGSFLAGTAS